MVSKAQQARDDKAEAIAELRKILKPGDAVYTVLRKVTSSGMSRHIDVYVIRNNHPRWLTSLVSRACDIRRANQGHGPLVVGGCGMDMGFHVVYSLSSVLYRDSFKCTGQRDGKKRCPANDHFNDYGALQRQYDVEHDPEHVRRDAGGEVRSAYVAERQAWIASQEDALWSRQRVHSDGGYALRQEWL